MKFCSLPHRRIASTSVLKTLAADFVAYFLQQMLDGSHGPRGLTVCEVCSSSGCNRQSSSRSAHESCAWDTVCPSRPYHPVLAVFGLEMSARSGPIIPHFPSCLSFLCPHNHATPAE
jgi:hypothetical protein